MGEVKLNATPFLISKRSITPRRGDSVHAVVATALRNDGLKRRIQISNSERICVRVLAARCARGLQQLHPPSEERAQGKPDADRTRVVRTKSARVDHRFNRITPAFPARMVYGLLRALPGDRAFLPPSPGGLMIHLEPGWARCISARLDASIGAPGPHH